MGGFARDLTPGSAKTHKFARSQASARAGLRAGAQAGVQAGVRADAQAGVRTDASK